MRDNLTQTLYNDFPDLYWQHTLDETRSLMCYGFCCGDGWYDIICTLYSQIAAIIASYADAHAALRNKSNSNKSSRFSLLWRRKKASTEHVDEEAFDPRMYSAVQVKEKFGTLRFYVSKHSEEIEGAIAKAAAKTEKTCEACSAEGIMRRGLCGSCEEVRQAELRDRRRRPRRDSGVILDKVS